MTPQTQSLWIAALPNLLAEGWHSELLTRQGSVPPPLLYLAAGLAGVDEAVATLRNSLPVLAQLAAPVDGLGQTVPWAERPERQVQRVVQALLAGQRLVVADNPATLGLDASTAAHSPLAQAHLSQAMDLAAQWLQQASAVGPLGEPTHRLAPYRSWHAPDALGPECRLPVALVVERPFQGLGPEGVPAELCLRLVRARGARLCLAPAPSSALLLRVGTEWDDTLARLQQQLQRTLVRSPAWPLEDLAIAWDLHRSDGGALGVVAGGSAGASFALGALWLLRGAAPPDWAPLLRPLLPRHLRRLALTATLEPGWGLGPVGGVREKGQALRPLARALAQADPAHPLTLGVFRDQPLPQARPGDVPTEPFGTLWHVAEHLVRQADALSPEQQQLWLALVAPGHEPPAVSHALIKAVAAQPAQSLRQYLLRCWAQCGLALRGRLHQRFVEIDLEVPLEVAEDAMGADAPLLQQGAGPYDRLLKVLQVHDASSRPQAYLLTGPAGAGKSTLLRHHLQQAARRLLQHEYGSWEPRPDESDEPPCEVPVYLPLKALPEALETAELPAWLQAHWADAGPPELAQLLAGRGAWFDDGLRARVMLDGLNEVAVARMSQRGDRAGAVVDAVRAQLRHALPLLLSKRPRHRATLSFPVLEVMLTDWQEPHIRRYLAGVFGPEAHAARWEALAAVKGAVALCGRPMHLAAQCELMRSGFAAPPGDRAALYQAWLWLRLRRCLGHAEWEDDTRQVDHTVWQETGPDIADQRLLTAADRAAIEDHDAWRLGRARPLPMQGQLLRSLARQALDQWKADAEAGQAAGERTANPQPWASVAPWLAAAQVAVDFDTDLRHRFGRAARDLGLVQLDDGFTEWCFDHQSWGEYLASLHLLAGEPALPPWLLQRLQAPALPYATDEEEIAAFDQAEASAWRAVPQAVWDELARDGLSVPDEHFINGNFDRPAADAQELALMERVLREESRAADFADGTLAFIDEGEQRVCHANLVQWGDTTGVGDSLGLGRQAWRDAQQAGGAGWQFLVTQRLDTVFQARFWAWLGERLDDELLRRLKAQHGRLSPPPVADGAEVLGLALLGLPEDRLAAWLQALCTADATPGVAPLWPALEHVLPQLQARLEPQGAWGERAAPALAPKQRPPPNDVLQHLRRVLLLTALDAGAASAPGVAASGQLALLDAPPPVPLPAPLQAHWQRLRAQAFQGPGQRLRRRLQAGLMLGALGDNLRYQFRCPQVAPGQFQPGLRPHPVLWAAVGRPGRLSRFAIGGGPFADEQPAWVVRLPGFLACRLPLTVGEWQWFLPSAQSQGFGWTMQHDPLYNNPAQPITGISARAVQAYAAWAQALYADDPRPCRGERATLQVPTELQWEALARGPLRGVLGRFGQALRSGWRWRRAPGATAALHADAPTRYNHARSRCGRPSPVGVFSRGITALGLADVQGQVWEWCASALTPEQLGQGWQPGPPRDTPAVRVEPGDDRFRALRGGAFDLTAAQCCASFRDRGHPDSHLSKLGVRLVRVWPPHSGPRSPWRWLSDWLRRRQAR
ncbi:SUMF1/EgtB/PvdO family nonheme iron enzyme [Ideonella sp. 4Y16]|uniref:formylglycine-generating enzyme family protein n=1 Tax=Ideonella alba TaxID=2824118 RepID=UPI001B3792C9|nr:formylglycine-generating enzyme family protein [Ideonella alba]MBQ0942248.1 SUMF1/EgtB/PvdO family nonheme iron enzyme [Ideonella alba]